MPSAKSRGELRSRHVPIRTCVACRTAGDKRGLLRVVRRPDGQPAMDLSGKANGRGAYICFSADCLAACRKQRKLERSLAVPVPPSLYDEIAAQIEAHP